MEVPKVFISYARPDVEYAIKLAKELRNVGLNIWIDKDSLLVGQVWKEEIQKAIQNSDYVIALLSSNSINRRGYVQAELKYALEVYQLIPSGDIFLLPARLDNCQIKDIRLKELHWVDLFPGWKDGIDGIMKALGIPRESPSFDEEEEDRLYQLYKDAEFSQPPSPSDIKVNIIRPAENEEVPEFINMEGTVFGDIKNAHLWVVSKGSNCDQYYPQGKKIRLENDYWRLSSVRNGASIKDIGISYKLIVVQANDIMNEAFELYFKIGRKKDKWFGSDHIDGTRQLATVTVIRKR